MLRYAGINLKNSIEIEHLNLTLSKQKILKDINIRLEPGKIYGVVGKNGSGKSMLFKCM